MMTSRLLLTAILATALTASGSVHANGYGSQGEIVRANRDFNGNANTDIRIDASGRGNASIAPRAEYAAPDFSII